MGIDVLFPSVSQQVIIAFTVFLAVISFWVFNFKGNPSKRILSLLQLVLIIVRLVSIVVSTIRVQCGGFIELLVSQPRRRVHYLVKHVVGLAASMCAAFLVGCVLPVLMVALTNVG